MKNLAGDKECDKHIKEELSEAGIKIIKLPIILRNEVPASIIGKLNGWNFERAWYYWIAKADEGAGLPFDIANELHPKYGQVVRVAGRGGDAPKECYCKPWHLGVPLYHIDTQEGLNALAEAINKVADRKEK